MSPLSKVAGGSRPRNSRPPRWCRAQHGLAGVAIVAVIALLLTFAGLALAAIWMRLGVHVKRRVVESAALVMLAAGAIVVSSFVRPNWDTSENRYNSFPEADERVLQQIHAPLTIEVHLAPEDPRRTDLETHALSKLRRILPHLTVRYVSATSIGIFEQANAGYGEIWYELNGRKAMRCATTAEATLEAIYLVAGIPAPSNRTKCFPCGTAYLLQELHFALLLFGLAVSVPVKRDPGTKETQMKPLIFLIAVSLSAADIKVDLKNEQVGKAPIIFEPMVGT